MRKKKDEFEVRRKGIETGFDILFFFEMFDALGYILFKLLYVFGVVSIDVVSVAEVYASVLLCCMMFVCTRLAHRGYLTAGIFGIIVALINITLSGLILQIIGVLLLLDSVLYLFKYKNTDKNKNRDDEKKLIVSYLVFLIILIFVFWCSLSSKNSNYSASVGETLKIREFYKYNVKILSSLEEYSIKDSFVHDGDYVRLQVSIENLEKKLNIDFTNAKFYLLNDKKEEIYSENVNVCYSEFDNCIQNVSIKSKSRLDGYLYFYNYKDGKKYVTDFSKINEIKYLKIMAMVDSDTSKDYYLELK